MRQRFFGWIAQFGFAILLLVACLIGLSLASLVAGFILASIPGIGMLILNPLTAAGEYTSRYPGYFLIACVIYAFAISLFIRDLVIRASKGSKHKSGRTEIYLQFYAVLIVYVLPTVLWEAHRFMGYR